MKNKVFLEKIDGWITKRGNKIPLKNNGEKIKYIDDKIINKDIEDFYKVHKLGGSCYEMSKYMSEKYGFGMVQGSLFHNNKGDISDVNSHYINIGFNGELLDFSSPTQYKTSKDKFLIYKKIDDNIYANKKINIKNQFDFYDKMYERMYNDNELVIFLKGE